MRSLSVDFLCSVLVVSHLSSFGDIWIIFKQSSVVFATGKLCHAGHIINTITMQGGWYMGQAISIIRLHIHIEC